jgi:hypothetical protein
LGFGIEIEIERFEERRTPTLPQPPFPILRYPDLVLTLNKNLTFTLTVDVNLVVSYSLFLLPEGYCDHSHFLEDESCGAIHYVIVDVS